MKDLFDAVSTIDTGERSDFDFYETPAWFVRSLLHYHDAIRGRSVLEPASGRDAITAVLRDEFLCRVFTNDLDARQPAQSHYDATLNAYWDSAAPPVEWVITNPPFDIAFDILTRAKRHASHGVAPVAAEDVPGTDEGTRSLAGGQSADACDWGAPGISSAASPPTASAAIGSSGSVSRISRCHRSSLTTWPSPASGAPRHDVSHPQGTR